MSLTNLEFTFHQGEIGKVMNFYDLSDESGTFNLDPYTVTLNLEKNGAVTVDDAVVVKADQGTNPGDCSHTLDATTAAIAVGRHKGNLRLVKTLAPTNKFYWPCNKNSQRAYFYVNVLDPVD
jgi:hypothetical protein